MLVQFTSEAGPNITMFEEDAARLLRMMNHSGTVPSAILAEDIETALAHLEGALTDAERQTTGANPVNAPLPVGTADAGQDEEESVDIRTRAYPLVQLLKAAKKRQAAIMWDYI